MNNRKASINNILGKGELLSLLKGTALVRIIGLLLGFLVGIQLARYLGVKEYGIYSTVMAVVSILMIPTELGLPRLLTREIARDSSLTKYQSKTIIQWALKQVIRTSILSTALLIIYYNFSNTNKIGLPLLYASALIPLTALLNIHAATLRGLNFIVSSQVLDTLVRFTLFTILLFTSYFFLEKINASYAIFLSAISVLVPLVFSHLYLKQKLPGKLFNSAYKINKTKSREYWSSAIPMALTEGMMIIRSNFQVLALGLIASLVDVGIFKIATATLFILSLPITIVNISLSPLIARINESGNIDELSKLLHKAAVFLFSTTLILFLPFIFFGQEIFSKAYGADYIEAVQPFYILGLGMLISAFFGANSMALNMMGYEKYVLKSGVYSLLLLLVLSIPLIYGFTTIGAAIASSLALVYWHISMWLFCKKNLQLDTSLLSLKLIK